MDLQYRLRTEYISICKANGGVLISTENSVEDCYNAVKKEVERVIKNETGKKD